MNDKKPDEFIGFLSLIETGYTGVFAPVFRRKEAQNGIFG